MFIPIRPAGAASSDGAIGYPEGSSIRESDWHRLAAFWHPVAYSKDVGPGRPVAARLLDVDLVVYRTAELGVVVALDRCPHRGARVSQGRIVDGQLVCPMHGLHFGGEGQCTRVPSLAGANVPIPPRLRLQACAVQERHGLVWASFKEVQSCPLPEWPGIGDDPARHVYPGPHTWNTSAGRHVENFNDIAHFPWVHTQSFGGDEQAAVPAYTVAKQPHGLSFDVGYVEGFNRFPDGVPGEKRHVRYLYELTFPFATLITVCPDGSDYRHLVADVAAPVSATSTRVFQILTDTSERFDAAYWLKDADTINQEDVALVEGQSPKELPLDLRMEVSLPSDRLSREYRTELARRFGLGRGDAP